MQEIENKPVCLLTRNTSGHTVISQFLMSETFTFPIVLSHRGPRRVESLQVFSPAKRDSR